MKEKRKILIVEDHTLLRVGLRALLAQDPEIEVVGESEDGRDALRVIGVVNPDLVLMDLSMPRTNGVEAIREVKRRYPNVRVLVLTLHKAEEYIHESLKAGADGYILKDATHEELRIAIHTVLRGKTYLSPDISGKVISGYLGGSGGTRFSSAWDMVTHRERQVLKLVAEGHSNKHIAEYLCLSVKTVEKHRANLMKKLDLHSASTLTAFAIDRGLVSSDASANSRTLVRDKDRETQ
jgi:two-component system response regulator NreC